MATMVHDGHVQYIHKVGMFFSYPIFLMKLTNSGHGSWADCWVAIPPADSRLGDDDIVCLIYLVCLLSINYLVCLLSINYLIMCVVCGQEGRDDGSPLANLYEL